MSYLPDLSRETLLRIRRARLLLPPVETTPGVIPISRASLGKIQAARLRREIQGTTSSRITHHAS